MAKKKKSLRGGNLSGDEEFENLAREAAGLGNTTTLRNVAAADAANKEKGGVPLKSNLRIREISGGIWMPFQQRLPQSSKTKIPRQAWCQKELNL
jgi:hypothetical protein